MAERVKIRLKTGSRELEAEGPRADVDELLAKWWRPDHSSDGRGDDEGDGAPPKRVSKNSPRASGTSIRGTDKSAKFDPQPTLNEMRSHENYDRWETKVLHAKSAINKIRLVCWYHEEPLTTGEIRSVLTGLGVKMGLPNVSNAIKAQLADFLQDGARKGGAIVRYKLTGKAAAEFEKWLEADDGS